MTPLEEKIQRQKEFCERASKSIQMFRMKNDPDKHCPVCGLNPNDLDEFVQSIATQAVEEYKKELLDVEFRAPADKSDDWHAGIRYCLEKFRNIISKPNI